MKNLLLGIVLALPVLFSGCSEDKDKLSLNTSEVSLYAEETKELTASEKVEWSSESKFVAEVSENGLLTAHHVGKTFITATCANGAEKCLVEVKPQYNTYLEPVLAFGASKSTVKSQEKRTLNLEESDVLRFSGENSHVLNTVYLFEDAKLVATAVGVRFSKTEEVVKFLMERYQVIAEENGVYYFINNEIEKTTMAITLEVKSTYLMITYVSYKKGKTRGMGDMGVYQQKLKSLLGL